jgi:hypothetical protein
MDTSREIKLWAMKWYIWAPAAIVVGLILWAIGYHANAGDAGKASGDTLEWFGIVIFGGGCVVTIFAALILMEESVKAAASASSKLENVLTMMNQQRELLGEISRSARLSDVAKEVLFRDMDRRTLREAVLEKLHQLDFTATFALIDDIAHRPGYKNLAEDLKLEADKYRGSNEAERMRQSVVYIEKLIDDSHWAQAKAHIDRYAATFDDKKRAESLMTRLNAKRGERKQELMTQWNESVRKQDVDASLLILKELDGYLTQAEGLALQESVREVVRSKLQSMGVQFSLAVNEKRWADALAIGEEIMKDFPNTKMAQEIRSSMDSLRQHAGKDMTA